MITPLFLFHTDFLYVTFYEILTIFIHGPKIKYLKNFNYETLIIETRSKAFYIGYQIICLIKFALLYYILERLERSFIFHKRLQLKKNDRGTNLF